ncbi:riboflavin kinase [Candidatus Gottesmanbacteria bacterium]|nr:riboflavin kinase [Candidatus Gottesmanbacteria bacterium]
MRETVWFKAKVIQGKRIAHTLGFPTINLDNPTVLHGQKEGVYACLVKLDTKIYKGVLYYGPRLILGEIEKILEIFVFDFEKEIYGETVSFQTLDFIRGVQNFPNFNAFKKQLVLDCQKAKEILK